MRCFGERVRSLHHRECDRCSGKCDRVNELPLISPPDVTLPLRKAAATHQNIPASTIVRSHFPSHFALTQVLQSTLVEPKKENPTPPLPLNLAASGQDL